MIREGSQHTAHLASGRGRRQVVEIQPPAKLGNTNMSTGKTSFVEIGSYASSTYVTRLSSALVEE